MEVKDFNCIWALLNRRYKECGGVGTIGKDLTPRGICTFAEKVRGELDQFIDEVIARAKAEDENAIAMAEHNRAELGERYANAEPAYAHGLKFGDKEPV
jgi:hypothetical protein